MSQQAEPNNIQASVAALHVPAHTLANNRMAAERFLADIADCAVRIAEAPNVWGERAARDAICAQLGFIRLHARQYQGQVESNNAAHMAEQIRMSHVPHVDLLAERNLMEQLRKEVDELVVECQKHLSCDG